MVIPVLVSRITNASLIAGDNRMTKNCYRYINILKVFNHKQEKDHD